MEPADPNADYRLLVARGYDACAQSFNEARSQSDEDLASLVRERLTLRSRILDLGCGGLPVSRWLAEKHQVVGVDISATQVRLARRQVPDGQFMIGDMTSLAFRPQAFDAVVSFYAIFHTPRTKHETLFRRIYDWLRPGGQFVVSLATHESAGYTEEFFGVEMFWSNFEMHRYRTMLTSCGFRILDDRIISHGYDADAPAERHPLVIAEKA
ncbi:MAG: class I SAM-dependent methyltransferase [Dehalococcoidia bacterium]